MMKRAGCGHRCLLVALLAMTINCYQMVFKAQDEKNVRRQFHIPAQVKDIFLEGHPKKAGFFGREGLKIRAIFAFNDVQLEAYLRELNNPAIWKPVPFISYSPARADDYSEAALIWRGIPAPSRAFERLKGWEFLPEIQNIRRGRYYGSAIATRRGRRVEHPGGGHHYEWDYVGLALSELAAGESAVVWTFGILDLDTGRLYVSIEFSG